MKKVVFIHLFNDRSGSPKVLSQVIAAAREAGVFTEVITSEHPFGFLNNVAHVQRRLFFKRSENKYVTLFYYFLSQLLLFISCFRYFTEDVTFYVNTMMPIGAALAGKLMGKRVYYHVQETYIKPPAFKKMLRSVIRLTARKVFFVSAFLKDAEGFPGLEQHVIYNALDKGFGRSEVKSAGKGAFKVLMVCSLKKYKGVMEFFDIARRLADDPKYSFVLVLNASLEEIESYFRGTAIPSNVTLHPRQSDVTPFYGDADLLLNLSRPDECVETFGLTILEAMSYGIPVVAPPVGGPREVVRDAREGFLISCYDTEGIVRVIKQLAADPSEYSRLAANAKARSRDFSESSFREGVYRAVLG